MARRAANSAQVVSPNLGLYLGRSPLLVPSRALQDGLNFRIRNGQLYNNNVGWAKYSDVDFGDPVTLIDTFFIRGGSQKQIIGTTRNLFDYNPDADTATYINPRYATGTVAVGGNDTATKVLLHGDGTDTSTTITDSNTGGSVHTWTAAANAQIDTAQSKFGGASILFDGTGDFVSTPDHADFTLGSGAFTWDGWVRTTTTGTALNIAGQANAAGLANADSAWSLAKTAGNVIVFSLVQGTTVTTVTGTTALAANTWMHIAAVRTGNVLKLFINGVQEGGDIAFTGAVNDSASVLAVGRAGAITATEWNGWVEEFRLSNSARWTANFTPPIAAYAGALIVTGVGTAFVTADIKEGDFISFGSATQTSLAATWYEVDSVDSETQLTLVTGPAAISSSVYTIRIIFTGEETDAWMTATFLQPDDGTGDDLWFATNGVDYVVTWDGSATQVVVRSALAFKCQALTVYKNMMIYLNLLLDAGESLPTSFINSDIGKPLDVTNGLAGQFRAHSNHDQIQNADRLGDNLVIYSEETVTLVQFVGDPIVFAFRDVTAGIGLLAPRLLCNFGNFHEFIHSSSQYIFDGATVTEIGKQVWREVLNRRDVARKELSFTHIDEEAGELHWVVALTSDAGVADVTAPADKAYVEHYLEQAGDQAPSPFSARSSPFLCGGYGVTAGALTFDQISDTWDTLGFRWNDSFLAAAFPISLMGGADGFVYKISAAQDGDGTSLPSFALFGRRALGDGRMRGLLARVYPYSEQTSVPLTVTSRLGDHAEGPVTITDSKTFDGTLPEGGHFVSPYRAGRFFELQFSTDGSPWSISGYDADIKPGGFR